MRREVPEEYWTDFDRIRALLTAEVEKLVDATSAEARRLSATTCDGACEQRGSPAHATPFRRTASLAQLAFLVFSVWASAQVTTRFRPVCLAW